MKVRRWLRWRTDRDLDEEIESHLDLDIQANIDRGLAPEQARRQGRDFGSHDTADDPPVMIINQTMARQYFAGEDPIGKRVTLDFVPDDRPREIIGVVGDTSTGRMESARTPAV